MHKSRIAVFTGNKDTFSNPSLIAFFSCCKKRNLIVDLYCPTQALEIPSTLENICVHIVDPKRLFSVWNIKVFLFSFAYLPALAGLYKLNPLCIIGVDPKGIVLAGRINRLLKKKLIYFSFEIFFRDEIKSQYYLNIKDKESYYSNRSDIIVIQDQVRMNMLAKENPVGNKPIWHFVPVAPLPINHKLKPVNLAEKYNVPQGKTVIVLSGSVDSWSGLDYVIYALEKGVHPDSHLFIHSRFKLNPENTKHQRLIALERSAAAVTINDQYFSNESDYFDFLSSFDVGLVLYIPDDGVYTGKNIKHIGLASGKFAAYCMIGLSVIFHADDVYQDLNSRYQFGYMVSTREEFAELLAKPLMKPLKSGSKKLYDDKLMPTNSIDQLIDRIMA